MEIKWLLLWRDKATDQSSKQTTIWSSILVPTFPVVPCLIDSLTPVSPSPSTPQQKYLLTVQGYFSIFTITDYIQNKKLMSQVLKLMSNTMFCSKASSSLIAIPLCFCFSISMDVQTKVLQNKDQITVVPAVSVVLSLFLAFFWPLFASTAALLVGMIAAFRGGFQVGTKFMV